MISVFIYIIDTDTDYSEFIKNRLKSINYPIDFVVINLCDTISFPKPNIESFSLEALKKFIDSARKYFIFDVKSVTQTELGDGRDVIDTNVKNTEQILSPKQKEITAAEHDIIIRSKDIIKEIEILIHWPKMGLNFFTATSEQALKKK